MNICRKKISDDRITLLVRCEVLEDLGAGLKGKTACYYKGEKGKNNKTRRNRKTISFVQCSFSQGFHIIIVLQDLVQTGFAFV